MSIFNQYSIRVPARDAVRQALTEAGVGTEIYYPVPMHQQECFAGKCRISGSMRESEAAAESILALPIYPELTKEQIDFVAQVVKENVRETQPA